MASDVGARSRVHYWAPDRPDNGESWMWSREIYGTLYSFTLVKMPSGEIRYFVKKFNGYVGGPEWGCAWDRAREHIKRPDGTIASRYF